MPASESVIELLFKIRAEADTGDLDKAREDAKKLFDVFGQQGQAVDKVTTEFTSLFEVLHDKGVDVLDKQVEKLGEELPVIGPAVSNITSKFLELGESGNAVRKLQDNLSTVAAASGKTANEVKDFLNQLRGIADAGERTDATFKFLGENLGTKVVPLVEAAAKSSKTFGDEVISAGKAVGKSDGEINTFVNSLVLAGDRTKAVSQLVAFLGDETTKKLTPAMDEASNAIKTLSAATNLPVGAITQFVSEFSKLGTAAEKTDATIGAVGSNIANNVAGPLAEAGAALNSSTGLTLGFVEAINSAVLALGPYGVAIIAVIFQLAQYAVAVGIAIEVTVEIGKRLFETAEAAAAFRNELFNVSEQTNISVETLSALEISLTSAGVGIRGLSQAIIQFQRQLEASKDLTSNQAALFQKLGVTSHDTELAFKQTLKGLNDLGEGTEQTAIAMQLFGRTGRSLINVLKETDGNIDAVVKRAKELGVVVGEDDAEKAHAFTEALDTLELQFRAMVGNDVIPAVTAAMEELSQIIADNQPAIETFDEALGLLAKAFISLLRPYVEAAVIALKLFNITVEASKAIIGPFVALLTPFWQGLKKVGEEIDKAQGFTTKHTAATKDHAKALAEDKDAADKAGESHADRARKLGEEIDFLKTLVGKTELSAEENKKLDDSYKSLSPSARKRIKEIEDETKRTEELIKAKEKQKQQNEDEARDAEREKRIAQAESTQGTVDIGAKATIDAARAINDQAKRDFEEGKIRRAEALKQDLDFIRITRDNTLISLKAAEPLLREKYQKFLDEQQAETTAGIAAKNALLQNLANQAKAENDFRNSSAAAQEKFRVAQNEENKRFAQLDLKNVQDSLANQRKELEDALKDGDKIRQRIASQSIGLLEIEQTKTAKSQVEEALKQSNLQVEVRQELVRNLNALNEKLLTQEHDFAIRHINLLIKTNTEERLINEKKIEETEQRDFEAQRRTLQSQLNQGSLEERKTVQKEIDNLEIKHSAVVHEQSERRKQIVREERDAVISALINEAETTVELVQQNESDKTEAIKRQTSERLITEEQATKKIIALRLATVNAQIALNAAQNTAAQAIDDPNRRAEREGQIERERVALFAKRKKIEDDSVLDLQDARQRDVDNERAYQEEISKLEDQEFTARDEAAKAVLGLMVATGAKRRDVIGLQLAIEANEENKRHEQRKREIDREKEILKDRIDFLQQYVEFLREVLGDEDEATQKAVSELAKANDKRAQLNKESEDEERRHAAQQALGKQKVDVATEQEDPLSKRSLFGDEFANNLKGIQIQADAAGKHLSNLQLNFRAAAKTAGDFFKEQSKAAGNFGTIAADAFNSTAQAVGSLVSNYVLMGTTGPAALRKILAATLAQVAGQATVKAIYEAAEGFALLAIGDFPGAASAFESSALYGSLALGSGLVGRALAGNLFQSGASGGSGAGGRGASSTSSTPSPIDISRQQSSTDIHIFVHAEPGPGFNDQVVNALVHNVKNNGDARHVIIETARD